MVKPKGSLTRFVEPPVVPDATTPTQVTRGKGKRVGVAVRLTPEDWYKASEFALRERTSLQKLFVAGLSELMRKRGLSPLDGE